MFNAYMGHTVVLIKKDGTRAWGERGQSRLTVRARVEDKKSLIRNGTGELVMLKAVVYIKEVDLSPSDRVEIDGVEHAILTIEKQRSFTKTSIMEVGVG